MYFDDIREDMEYKIGGIVEVIVGLLEGYELDVLIFG